MKRLLPLLLLLLTPALAAAQELYEHPGQATRWISPENRTGATGAGGLENQGGKGRPFETIRAGESLVMGEIQGAGIIRRIWLTVSERSPEMLRSLRLDMYWDGAARPAVSAPLGDFFGAALGRTVAFENALLSSPEARSFNSIIPMPFQKSARIVLTNESNREVASVFYDIDYTTGAPADAMYFHAYWHRQQRTTPGEAFRILPRVTGRGRYLGTTVGVVTDSLYGKSWWGEGEVRIFLDGDRQHPTLVGTGTEDYIGTGWGQGAYINRYQGAPIADEANRRWTFYRLHVPDPVLFSTACEVTLQQMGGWERDRVIGLMKGGAVVKPVTISSGGRDQFVKLLERAGGPPADLSTLPDGWLNFYRSDDVSATAYFYLDRPQSDLPPLAPLAERTAALE